ncbi:MAG: copper-containing nitrite reductase [bacterium]
MTLHKQRYVHLMVTLLVAGFLVVGCSNSTERAKTDQSAKKEKAAKDREKTPAKEPDVEEISRHPTNLPETTRYTLFKNGEYQKPAQGSDPITKEVHFNIQEVTAEVVDGTTREFWTFNGKIPGPMIRAKVGDKIDFHLHNPKGNSFPHNVDFHAVTGPGGGSVALDAVAGESSRLKAKLLQPGIYIYHCAFPTIPNHIEHGMYGLIVVEPKDGLPEVDHEYYMLQSEFYTELGGDQMAASTTDKGHISVSAKNGLLEEPTYVVFNGRPGAVTGDRALGVYDEPIQTGDTARVFVGNIGPNLISSFHVIGEIFDKVYVEGSFDLVNENVQSTMIPAGGAVGVEMTFEAPGEYIPVDHAIYRVGKGAKGIFKVEGEPNRDVYNPIKKSDVRGESVY